MRLSIASLAAATAFIAKVMLMTTAAQGQVSVLTQHNDVGRTGQNLSETILTPTSVNSAAFGKLFSYPVDGYIYAQPLYVPNVSIPGQGVHNLVFVTTEHDSVYAFDADGLSQTPVWQVSFINPSLGITTIPSSDVASDNSPTADIVPEISTTGTPVIDPQSGTLYVVAVTKEIDAAGNAHHKQRLHALDITTGAEKFGGPALLGDSILTSPYLKGGTSSYVSGPTVPGKGSDSTGGVVPFDAVWEFNRGGLLLLNGIVYVPWGSHGDAGPFHGWVSAYNAQTLGLVALFNTTPNGTTAGPLSAGAGAVWMAGGGPAADSAGNIYVSTGNGTFDVTGSSKPAYGDLALRLNPTTLSVADYFTPFEQSNLDANDLDLASGGVVVLPDQTGTNPHLLVAGGKEGKVYLINRDNMGKYQQCGATCDAVVSEFMLDPSGTGNGVTGAIFSVPAYFNGFVYYQGVNQVLNAFPLTNGTLSSSPASHSNTTFGFPGATPSISANGTSNGIVWTIQVDGYASGTPAVLHAYNALNLSSELYNSNQVAADQLAPGVKFSTPTIANGKVYVGTQTQLSVFGPLPGGGTRQGEVQSNYATPQTKTSSVAVTYTAAQSAGNLNVVVVGWNDASTTVSSVTDTSGNTYTLAVGPTRGTNLSQSIYYAKNIASAAANGNTVTVSFSAAADHPDIRILEYSGLKSLDVTAAAVGNSATSSSGTATTTSANEVLVAANTVATLTTGPGAGFTSRIITSPDGDIVEDQRVTATGSYQATAPLSSAGPWVMQMATFSASASGDTTPPTAPSSLTATAASASQINLAWTASTDNVGVTGYLVERCSGAGCTNFAQIGTPTSTSFSDTGLTASTSYSYRVRATDAAGNLSAYSNIASATTTGTTGGTIKFIQGNYAVPSSATTVTVTFTAAQTAGNLNVVVVGWNDTTHTVSSVTDSSGNTYVRAVGPTVGGGISQSIYYAKSIAGAAANANTVTVTFSAAATAPDIRILEYSGLNTTAPLDVTAAASGSGTSVSSGSATTTSANELILGATTVSAATSGVGSGFTKRIQTVPDSDLVEDRIVTATGSYAATSTVTGGTWVAQMATFSAAASSGDTTPPTAPSNLTATAASASQINLAWTASTDNVGVTGYLVERCSGSGCSNFSQISTPTSTTFSDTLLTANTSYSYRVRATDAAGNLSAYSNIATATTTAGQDTQPPTAPSSLTATAASASQINLAWTASTDNVGVTGYLVERCSGPGCSNFSQISTPTSTSFSDTLLTASTSYSYRVRATDAAGNLSAYSNTATATTTATTGGTIKFIQGNYQAPQSPSASVAVTYTAAQTAGDLNVVVVGWNDASTTVSSVTDTSGNTYTLAVGPTVQPGTALKGGLSQAIYYAKNIASAAANGNAVTVSFSAAAAAPDVRILEYSGLNPTSPLDVTAAAVGNSATSSSGTATTTSASELLVGANMVFTFTGGAGAGFTNRIITKPDGDIAEDRIVTATGSYQATAPLSSAGPWIMQMAGFKP